MFNKASHYYNIQSKKAENEGKKKITKANSEIKVKRGELSLRGQFYLVSERRKLLQVFFSTGQNRKLGLISYYG